MTSSTDELSRELSAMTMSSAVSDDNSYDYSDDDPSDDDTSERGKLTRDSTSLSQSSSASTNRSFSRKSNEDGSSRVSSVLSRKSGVSSREPTDLSMISNGDLETKDQNDASSRQDTIASDAALSRENTGVTSPNSSKQSSRENTMPFSEREKSNISTTDDKESHSGSYYDDDFDDESEPESDATTREQSFVDSNNNSNSSDNDRGTALEKEDSVLIEKDGKFELVDEKDLTADQRNALGLKPKQKSERKQSQLKVPNGRVRKSSNPEYDHVQSSYAMSEQQKEMKSRRISVMQMRKQEEKQRLKQEQEEKQKAAEKSFNKWLAQKSQDVKDESKPKKTTATGMSEKAAQEEEERQKAADKAFKQWLDEKEERAKEEKKLEKIRLTEEAEAYVVRDRKTCDKAFREWLRKKKIEREKQETAARAQRKKSHAPAKKKSVYQIEEKKQRRPKSSVVRDEEKSDVTERKRRPKTSAVRITDTFGYRHPASIDDFIARK